MLSTVELRKKKVYLKDTTGINPVSLLLGKDVGFSENGGDVVEKIFSDRNTFSYPKPTSMIKHLLKISTKPNSIILDFFAGSGTTGQAVMELNEEDGGSRRWIMIEQMDFIETVTKIRMQKVLKNNSFCYFIA